MQGKTKRQEKKPCQEIGLFLDLRLAEDLPCPSHPAPVGCSVMWSQPGAKFNIINAKEIKEEPTVSFVQSVCII